MVIGAGPGGMKAALTAAQRGHEVHVYEKDKQAGGQVNLAEKLPGRAEFGGVTTNLIDELNQTNVTLNLNTPVNNDILGKLQPEAVVVATGAVPRLPEVGINGVEIVDAWSVIRGDGKIGNNVAVAAWDEDHQLLTVVRHRHPP